MDGSRFDDLTKRLATGASRRRVLRGLGAGVVAAVATAAGLRGARANHGGGHGGGPKPGRCGQVGHPCKWGTHCCTGTCLNGGCACPPATPNFCPATNSCLAACTDPGEVFDPATCGCGCPATTCCVCEGANNSLLFCSGASPTVAECNAACGAIGGLAARFRGAAGQSWVCDPVSPDGCRGVCGF